MGGYLDRAAAPSSMGPRGLILVGSLVISFSYLLYSANLLVSGPKDCPPDHNLSLALALTHSNSSSTSKTLTNTTNTLLRQIVGGNDNTQQEQKQQEEETNLSHIVFGIAASSDLWQTRKEYIKQWWRPRSTRGVVWIDKRVRTYRNESLPEIRVSGDTSKLPYSHTHGTRAALRLSRIVSETLRLKLKNVRWFVMGDDDTVFVVDNVVSVLQKFDHRQFYYIGSPSESHIQNLLFSYGMAFGGGGFAISYALTVELEKMQDQCISRYAHLYGSDDRIHACMTELGVPLTRHPGFHQFDIFGNLLGLLSAHPVAPLISLHHLDVVEPIFPDNTRPEAIHRLYKSIEQDAASIVQQSICYDRRRQWSISISWGYAVQVYRGLLSPRELEIPARTFMNWYRRANYFAYSFNTRPVAPHPCQEPFTYYISSVRYHKPINQTVSRYSRYGDKYPSCRWKGTSLTVIHTIVVFKKPDPHRWERVSDAAIVEFFRGDGNCFVVVVAAADAGTEKRLLQGAAFRKRIDDACLSKQL